CDVPNQGTDDQGKTAAGKLIGEKWDNEPGSVWEASLNDLTDKHLSVTSKTAANELKQRFKDLETRMKPAPVNLSEALAAWREEEGKKGALDLKKMHEAAGQIAFGLHKYIEAVDYFLKMERFKTGAIERIRIAYQRLFDGIAWQIRKEAKLCK